MNPCLRHQDAVPFVESCCGQQSWQVKAIDFQDLSSIPCVTCLNRSWFLYLLELELFLSFYKETLFLSQSLCLHRGKTRNFVFIEKQPSQRTRGISMSLKQDLQQTQRIFALRCMLQTSSNSSLEMSMTAMEVARAVDFSSFLGLFGVDGLTVYSL